MAKAMVLRAIASPLPIAWATADSAYGQEWRLRRWPRGLRAIRSWLTPAVALNRWWRAWTNKDPPTELQALTDTATTGHGIDLYHRMQRATGDHTNDRPGGSRSPQCTRCVGVGGNSRLLHETLMSSPREC